MSKEFKTAKETETIFIMRDEYDHLPIEYVKYKSTEYRTSFVPKRHSVGGHIVSLSNDTLIDNFRWFNNKESIIKHVIKLHQRRIEFIKKMHKDILGSD